MEKKRDWMLPVIFILLTELVGAVSSLLAGNIPWIYGQLAKPPLSPPGWLYGVVWPILYALIGYAAYRIYQYQQDNKALVLYFAQLFVNFLWPIVFFRFRLYWVALIVLLLLDVLAALTWRAFRKLDRWAGLLIVPYLLWLLFATYLNFGVALLN